MSEDLKDSFLGSYPRNVQSEHWKQSGRKRSDKHLTRDNFCPGNPIQAPLGEKKRQKVDVDMPSSSTILSKAKRKRKAILKTKKPKIPEGF